MFLRVISVIVMSLMPVGLNSSRGVDARGPAVVFQRDVTPQAATDITRGLILSGTMNVGKQSVVRFTSAIPLRIVPTSQ
jgi:hypothetical protein